MKTLADGLKREDGPAEDVPMTDIFAEQAKRSREVRDADRRRLAKAYGKTCKSCGGTGRVPDWEHAGEKPCSRCRHRDRRKL